VYLNEKRKDEVINAMATEDGKYLLILSGFGDKNNMMFADISNKDHK
jgi:hypothetical protein